MIIERGYIAQIIEGVGGIGSLAQIIGGIAALISAFAMIYYYKRISESVKEQVLARETEKFRVLAQNVLTYFIIELEDELRLLRSRAVLKEVPELKSSVGESSCSLFKAEFRDLARKVEAYDERCREIKNLLENLEKRALNNNNFVEDVKMVIETYPLFPEWKKDKNFEDIFERLFKDRETYELKRLIRHILWESEEHPTLGKEIAEIWGKNPRLFFKLIDKYGFRSDVDKLKSVREKLKGIAEDLRDKLEQKAIKLSSIYGFDIDKMKASHRPNLEF
ncbi:MAG: hypothetical protein KAT65_04290 [Methanophagales archaeon]|nr:hypothetical protein [Methanophagales archaeon]